MRGHVAVLASVTAHGVAVVVGAFAAVPTLPPRSDAAVVVALPARPPELAAEPIAVVFLDRDSPATDSAGTAHGDGDHRAGRASAAPGPTSVDVRIAGSHTGGEQEPARASGPTSGWLKMRGPELRIDDAFLERSLRNSPPPEVVPKSGRVAPAGGGTSVIRDRVATVTIDRDGKAHLHARPDVEVHWDIHLPTPGEIMRELREAGREVATWYEDPYKLARVGPAQDVPRHIAATPGACDNYYDACSVELRERDEPEGKDRAGGAAHGKLDASSWLMRKFVGDVYASRKLKLLDDSRAERADIGAQHAREDLARSAELMQRNLDALWRVTRDPAERRRALFALWDECGEGEGLVGEAGERARRMVIGWIRAKLPATSPDAFTADEIAELAAHRASKQSFVPYE